ncbi:hypothetical protein ACIGW1_19415 [Streptomyces sp. NPDC053780]|uniref:hypothetical protein n=1 Tax=unclassified Streptomyces TaxID=2593676 RepID=UPI000F74719F|nr:hypothetical protein [Streptomyces sp. WAC 04229]RSN59882.1 hypothetical protein DMH12_09425 [Streptomyces sp. WAC 04229]
MTTYVISVPGTFTGAVQDDTTDALARALRPDDPHRTHLGDEEDLDALSVNDDGTFTMRLTVEADTRAHAEGRAQEVADSALRAAGLDRDSTPLGPSVVTGIDSDV